MSAGSPPRASATPIVELASSTSAYATRRGSFFGRPAHVAERRRAVVAGPGVDAREIHHPASLRPGAAITGRASGGTYPGRRGTVPGDRRRAAGRRGRRDRREEQRAQADGRGAARPGGTTLGRVPDILDVEIMADLLRRLGCEVAHDHDGVDGRDRRPGRLGHQADYDLVRRMRASINVLGPLLARLGEADVALPGGDAIGSRPLDLHVDGLIRMGATVENEHGFLVATAPPGGLLGASVWLDFPSVGATENLLTAAVLAKGRTVIDNAAREPEIVDICPMLVAMGARINGVGTSTLEIEGVEALRPDPARRRSRPDRGRHLGGRRDDDPRRRHGARRAGRAPRDRAGQARDRGRERRAHGRRRSGSPATGGRPRSTWSPCRTRASRRTCSRWSWR